jgi:hypothetical protein
MIKFSKVKSKDLTPDVTPDAVLDRKLRGKQVVEMISGIYREIHNERILADLVIAALKVPSFSEENMRALLKDPHLPNSVRGMLLAKRVRA